MTNPNNSVGTNGAFGGRTSVNAFNDVMGALSRGILSGWECTPNSGLTVSIGGNGTARDTAVAEDNAGNRTSINNISNAPINVTIGAAPGSNKRIDAIVAYVDNPPAGNASETDNPDACGLIVVQGTTASTPVNPTDAQIRTGITADGASGTTAYYVVIAYITMASGTTDITANEIVSGGLATIGDNMVGNSSIKGKAVTAAKIDFSTFGENYSTSEQATDFKWIDGKTIYKKSFSLTTSSNDTSTVWSHDVNFETLIKIEGTFDSGNGVWQPIYRPTGSENPQLYSVGICDIRNSSSTSNPNTFRLLVGTAVEKERPIYVTMYYTK